MVFVGTLGAALVGIGLLENAGVKINEGSLKFVMECVKFGAILYILKLAAMMFLSNFNITMCKKKKKEEERYICSAEKELNNTRCTPRTITI